MAAMLVMLVAGMGSGEIGGDAKSGREEDAILLVEGGEFRAAIVVGPQATWIERHAAQELQRYVQAVTGAALPVVAVEQAPEAGDDALVLIGRAETNPLITEMVSTGSVVLSSREPGLDGFVIKSGQVKGRPALVLGGSQDRGTLYAVYELLEKQVGIGFFWAGERIPHAKDLALPPLDVSARPHFPVREYMQGCIFGYSTKWWGEQEWLREIDWAAKHKINQLYLMEPFVPSVAMRRTMAAFGVESGAITEGEWERVEMWQRVIAYARRLGMEVVNPAFTGDVPKAFREAHPEARYVERQWLDFAPSSVLYPTDPLFVEVGCRYAQEYEALFGTSHVYNAEPYGETRPGADEAEREAIKIDFARGVDRMIAAADPQGRWECTTWAFRDKEFWPNEAVRKYLEAIPDERFLVGDLWAEERPTYKEFEYFWGKRWGFGILHSFGGNTNLHGDLGGLVRSVQEVVSDPRASRCEAFQIMPEVIHYNEIYYDLATRLAWNPREVTLHGFLADYARRRYGEECAPTMEQCLRALAESVYGWQDLIPPLYQVKPDTDWALRGASKRVALLPGLRKALQIALECAETLGDEPIYRRDVLDLAKEYVGLLYTQHFLWLVEALGEGDGQRVAEQSRVLRALLDEVEKLLASHKWCHFRRVLEMARRSPGATEGIERELRQRFTTLGSYAELLDYARRDWYEMVRYYYRPRVEAYLEDAQAAVAAGKTAVDPEETDRHARELAQRWVEEGYPEEPIPTYDTLALAKEVLAKWPLPDSAKGEGDRTSEKESEIGPLHKPWDTAER